MIIRFWVTRNSHNLSWILFLSGNFELFFLLHHWYITDKKYKIGKSKNTKMLPSAKYILAKYVKKILIAWRCASFYIVTCKVVLMCMYVFGDISIFVYVYVFWFWQYITIFYLAKYTHYLLYHPIIISLNQ